MYRAVVLTCAGALLCSSVACRRPQAQSRPPDPPPSKPAVKIAPSTPLDVESARLGGPTWDKHWDIFIERSLPPALLTHRVPYDVRRYCPAFYRMSDADKRAWWAYFLQALAAAEAGLNSTTNVRHTEPEVAVPDHVTHRIVHQQGLLQLTYEDSQRYGCDFDWTADKDLSPHDPRRTILNPERNLSCGIHILSHQILEQHKPLFSPTSYWATLQPGTASFEVFKKQITNPPAACEFHQQRSRRPASEIAER